MSRSPSNSYQETQILTATPQKLRLMLIEGAIRRARHTLASWEERRDEEAFESLVRCREIVAELRGPARPDDGPLARQVASLYLFLFRTLAEAQFERSASKVEAALRILEIERETWRQLCEQMPERPIAESAGDGERQDVSAAGLGAITPVPPPRMFGRATYSAPAASQFSLEG